MKKVFIFTLVIFFLLLSPIQTFSQSHNPLIQSLGRELFLKSKNLTHIYDDIMRIEIASGSCTIRLQLMNIGMELLMASQELNEIHRLIIADIFVEREFEWKKYLVSIMSDNKKSIMAREEKLTTIFRSKETPSTSYSIEIAVLVIRESVIVIQEIEKEMDRRWLR